MLCALPACGSPGAAPVVAAPPLPPYALAEPLGAARLFAPGVISTEAPEFGISFEPDGQTAYFNRASADRSQLTIYVARFANGRWRADVAPFSGKHRDIDPFVTPDGARLYFASDRPRPGAAPPPAPRFALWYVERVDDGWSAPRVVSGPPNDDAEVGFVSLTRDGTLYFDAFVGGARGLYRAAAKGAGFSAPEPLSIAAGSGRRGNPMVAADGSLVVFFAELPDGLGQADLYAARLAPGGGWTPPVNLGAKVNSASAEFAPALSPDGRYLFFTSERPGVVPAPPSGRPPGDLYQIDLAAAGLR